MNTKIEKEKTEYRPSMEESIIDIIEEHKKIADNSKGLTEKIAHIILLIKESYKNGGKIILMGNGGSASDSEHWATEFSGILKLSAIALTSNSSTLTSIANDFGFENIFSRQLESIGNEKDLLIAISTSGNSENILRCIEVAKSKNIKFIGLTGKSGGKLQHIIGKDDILINVPSENTQRIQEIHEMIYHIIFEMLNTQIE